MKTLLLLRHAKSSWKDNDADDHERSLNKRGKNDAPRMGRLLTEEGLLPDLMFVSSAKRCRKTAEYVIQESGYRGETRITGELYEASAGKLRSFLAQIADDIGRMLIVGHNPGLEELLGSLVGNPVALTTAALAHVELPLEHWYDLRDDTRAEVKRLWQPRELED